MRIIPLLIITSAILTSCTSGNNPTTSTGAIKPLVKTGATSTGMTSTGMTSTGMTSTGMTSTGMTSTGMTSTGMANTGSTSTGMMLPPVSGLNGNAEKYRAVFNGFEQESFQIKHTSGTSTTVSFTNSGAKAIDIAISFPTATNNNLRVSQIIAPDGSMDGPFGREMQYNLKQNGVYQLIISENMMAEAPYTGTATVALTLQEKSYPNNIKILK